MSAYYNEHDPFAAAWLRELIADGLIAPGEVDERSIEDVRPDELAGFVQCHFFAGIGVWSYALRAAGWRDDEEVWTASCPCQPFSSAGKRVGFADERHLWPAFYHLAGVRRPTVIFGEQSSSKDGLAWLDLVSSDMEAADYTGGPLDICSAGFGAPNIRQRAYFVWLGYACGSRAGRNAGGSLASQARGSGTGRPNGNDGSDALVAASTACRLVHSNGERGCGGQPRSEDATDARLTGEALRMGHSGSDGAGPNARNGQGAQAADGRADGNLARRQLTPWHSGENGRAGAVNGFWGDADWLGCTDGVWRPVAPGTCPLVTGHPSRVALLRGAGNAINAEVAKGFVEAVMAARERSQRLAA